MSELVFDPLVFVQPGYEQADGDWPEQWQTQIDHIRALHPELEPWGRLAIGAAWGDYSQDIMAVGWVDWVEERNPDFLAYLYVRQIVPVFKFGGTGLFSEEVYQLGRQEPWLGNKHAAPAWALR